MALQIAEQEWEFVNPEKLPPPGTYADFLGYVSEKIEMSVDAVGVKNRAGYIVEAIRENYQDPELQKARAQRAGKGERKATRGTPRRIQPQAKDAAPTSRPHAARTRRTRRGTYPGTHHPPTAQ